MKIVIGSTYIGSDAKSNLQNISLIDEDEVLLRTSFESTISSKELDPFLSYLQMVNEIVVGHTKLENIDFLSELPNITEVKIMTSFLKNIEGLQYLKKLKMLSLERPKYAFNVLGKLTSLEELYVDEWRAGAKSIFHLRNLMKLSIHKFGESDLLGLSSWKNLKHLWFNAGQLQHLKGVPNSLVFLRLTNLRKLKSLTNISTCRSLEDLRIQGCKQIDNIEELQHCRELKTLTMIKVGTLDSLAPLQNLQNLEYLVFTDGVDLSQVNSVTVLNQLPKLQNLIITKKIASNFDHKTLVEQGCNVILTQG